MGRHLGKVSITRACRCIGLLQMVSAILKCSTLSLRRAKFFFQSYKNKNDNTALARVKHVEELGCKAIF